MTPDSLPQPLPGSSTRSFIASIAERHGVARTTRGAERTLRFAQLAYIVTSVRRMFTLRFSPHVQVSVAVGLEPFLRGPREFARHAPRDHARPAVTMCALRHEALTARLVERESRISSVDVRASSRVLQSIEEVNRTRSPPDKAPARDLVAGRLLARPVSAATAAAKVAAALRRSVSGAASLRPERAALPDGREMPASVDVGRLTRDVMRAIDERIVAHRERQGQG